MEEDVRVKKQASDFISRSILATIHVTDCYDFIQISKSYNIKPEKILLLFVLKNALETYQNCASSSLKKRKMLFSEIGEWITSNKNDWIFDFVSICDEFDLSPDYVRRELSEWLEAQKKARSV